MTEMNVTSALELLLPRERAMVATFLTQQTELDACGTVIGTSSSEFCL